MFFVQMSYGRRIHDVKVKVKAKAPRDRALIEDDLLEAVKRINKLSETLEHGGEGVVGLPPLFITAAADVGTLAGELSTVLTH